jgi:hypothetical protein
VKQRCAPIMTDAVVGDVFVGLDGTQAVEKLPDQDGKPGRAGDEQMDAADIAPAAASLTDALDQAECGIRCLRGCLQIGRLAAPSPKAQVAAERRHLGVTVAQGLFGVVVYRHHDRHLLRIGVTADLIDLHRRCIAFGAERPHLLRTPRSRLSPGEVYVGWGQEGRPESHRRRKRDET